MSYVRNAHSFGVFQRIIGPHCDTRAGLPALGLIERDESPVEFGCWPIILREVSGSWLCFFGNKVHSPHRVTTLPDDFTHNLAHCCATEIDVYSGLGKYGIRVITVAAIVAVRANVLLRVNNPVDGVSQVELRPVDVHIARLVLGYSYVKEILVAIHDLGFADEKYASRDSGLIARKRH